MSLPSGTVLFGRYRVKSHVRREGLGNVFIAEQTLAGQTRISRRVAVKVLAPNASESSMSNPVEGDEALTTARFIREAQVSSSVCSNHILPVFDYGKDESHGLLIVFELREGEILSDRLRRTGPISIGALHPLIEQAWQGLADLHAADILHNDISPTNMLIDVLPNGRERLTLLNLGFARLITPQVQVGKDKPADPRSDIYSCAAVIFQALSGEFPYRARNLGEMVVQQGTTDARRLSEIMPGRVDSALDDFLARALARDPTARFESATAALAAWRRLGPN